MLLTASFSRTSLARCPNCAQRWASVLCHRPYYWCSRSFCIGRAAIPYTYHSWSTRKPPSTHLLTADVGLRAAALRSAVGFPHDVRAHLASAYVAACLYSAGQLFLGFCAIVSRCDNTRTPPQKSLSVSIEAWGVTSRPEDSSLLRHKWLPVRWRVSECRAQ